MPEMSQEQLGVTGAKRSRYYPESPDALLRKLVEQHPSATETEIEELFEENALKYGSSILSAIIAYWFANRYRALMQEGCRRRSEGRRGPSARKGSRCGSRR